MHRKRLLLALVGVVAALVTLIAGPASAAKPGGAFTLTSSAFIDGGTFPSVNHATFCSADGTNTRPPLSWSGAPKGTKSFAIVLDDRFDLPEPSLFTHWITWNIAAGRTTIGPGRSGRSVGANDLLDFGFPPETDPSGFPWGYLDYFGPCPPSGTGVHNYTFHLYALSARLDLPAGAPRADFFAAMQPVLLAETTLFGIVDAGPPGP